MNAIALAILLGLETLHLSVKPGEEYLCAHWYQPCVTDSACLQCYSDCVLEPEHVPKPVWLENTYE